MSIWDHVKPSKKVPAATSVDLLKDGAAVRLTWDDGQVTAVSSRTLRQLCPCAECVDEWTNKRTFDPALIKPDMRIMEKHPVGNYAVSFRFADGHGTGIFHWTFLRETSEKHPYAQA